MQYTYEVLDYIVPEDIEKGDAFPWSETDNQYDSVEKSYSLHNLTSCMENIVRDVVGEQLQPPIISVEDNSVLYPLDESERQAIRIVFNDEGVIEKILLETEENSSYEFETVREAIGGGYIKTASIGIGQGQGAVEVITYDGTLKQRKDDRGKDMLKGNGHKKVKAAKDADDANIENKFIEDYKKRTGDALPSEIQNDERKLIALATSYASMVNSEKNVLIDAISEIDSIKHAPSMVLNLMGEMIKEVPLENVDDMKEVGFASRAATRGNQDDIFALKALCGWKQAGKNVADLKTGSGEPLVRDEIEEEIAKWRQEKRNDRRKKDGDRIKRGLTETQQQVVDALESLGVDKTEAEEFVRGSDYKSKASAGDNVMTYLRTKGRKL